MSRATYPPILLLAALSAPLAAANRLVNPGFDEDLSGWQQPFGNPAAWSTLDYESSPSSGSALLTNVQDPSNGAVPIALRQCVVVAPNQRYGFGAQVYLPSGQPQFSAGVVFVEAFLGDACSGSNVGIASAFQFEPVFWFPATATIETGPGVGSLRLSVGVMKNVGVSEPAHAFFDAMFLVSDALFANGFEAESGG